MRSAVRSTRASAWPVTAVLAACVALLAPASVAHATAVGSAPGAAHARIMGSPLECPTCHASATVLFAAAGIPDGMTHAGDDEACLTCHTGGGDAPQVYGGDPNRYFAASGFGHDEPDEADCTDCHSVHGPWVRAAGLDHYLLKVLEYQAEAVADADPDTAPRDRALSAWCTGCHPLWPVDVEDLHGVPLNAENGGCENHPFAEASPGVSGTACEDCFSCHGAGGAGAISHDTPGADAGLVMMGDSVDSTVPAPDRSWDGVCLRCHRAAGF